MLKLLKKGVVDKNPKYVDLLRKYKFYFIPVVNVDGLAKIESEWVANKQIYAQRKNMDTRGCNRSQLDQDIGGGVDINRNFGVDWGQVDEMQFIQSNPDY